MFGGGGFERTTSTKLVSQLLILEFPTMLIFLYLFIFWNTWCFSQAMLLSLGCAILSEAALSTMKMVFHLHLWWLMKLDMCEYNWTSVSYLKWFLV